mmetsp:Transcript_50159/g.100949  ORF Transcript_50159/g.100949 Transcript_50159/m.100949 type:complete len:307 (+) Transcript_50159:81-1001(+)
MVRRDANEGRKKEEEEGSTDAGSGEASKEGSAAPAESAEVAEGSAAADSAGAASDPPAADSLKPAAEDESDPMEDVMKLAEKREFDRAAAVLEAQLRRRPDDDQLMHNLGVILTEQRYWAEAEEMFTKAFDSQRASKKLNFATMFGLGTVLTEQGTTMKLLQGEALFRDCLQMAIEQEEKGIQDTYRSFVSLAENLQQQKRWSEAAEAWKPCLELASRMFGETSERATAHKAALDRAERLAKYQRAMRMVMWGVTLATPVVLAWIWRRAGLGYPWDFLMGTSTDAQNATVMEHPASDGDGMGSPSY